MDPYDLETADPPPAPRPPSYRELPHEALRFLTEGDFCSRGFFALLVLWIGYGFARSRPRLLWIGVRLGSIAYGLLVLVGGLQRNASQVDDWFNAALGAFPPVATALGLAWILLPTLGWLADRLMRRPLLALERAWWDVTSWGRRRRDRIEADRRRRIARIEWERDAPRREQERLRAEEQAKVRAAGQRQREDARAQALLEYRLVASRLGKEAFPRADFDAYLKTFMGDDQEPGTVERRGAELVEVLRRQHRDEKPPAPEHSIEELVAWYGRQKAQLQGAQIDEIMRDTLLANLAERFQELMDRQVEGTRP